MTFNGTSPMPVHHNVNNLILSTDSYKLGHWNQYPKGTEAIYSYFEARKGAQFPYTVFFGLQYLLKKYLVGRVVNWADLMEASKVSSVHMGEANSFNYQGWAHIIEKHGGKLPLRIKAVPEGTPVPTGNVLMTVENTDPECYWLTNALESLLTHVWYPSTVATLSRSTLKAISGHLEETALSLDGLPFMLHDFGYRGASSHETAALGGAAHLVNSMGTDTLPALVLAEQYYGADPTTLGFSVAATEHSVMTAEGEDGEEGVVDELLTNYPKGILSVVSDSYDIYRFVKRLGSTFKDRIMAREGVFVCRPDSVTPTHPTPEALTLWIVKQLWKDFGGTVNWKGFKVLDPHIRCIWGDGIDPAGIDRILATLTMHSFSTENMVFGMGGGLLQKVNRDTQRFAFKASSTLRDGVWHDVQKKPLDASKASKAGKLSLVIAAGEFYTVPQTPNGDLLETVFENGVLIEDWTFDEVRSRAK